jgi:YVTN family beta-propeller protein
LKPVPAIHSSFAVRFSLVVLVSVLLPLAWFAPSSLSHSAQDTKDATQQPQKKLPPRYINFEGPHVHPIAMTPDGSKLLALNTPNHQLAVFQVRNDELKLLGEITVGLVPVSVAARNDREAWVVNWLSDSVSVVDLQTLNVVRTFDAGDEPADVVFAGAPKERAFITVSGLNQVNVYDPDDPQAVTQVIEIRGKQPRALARDAAGQKVFVSVFESGNETTVVPRKTVIANGGGPPLGWTLDPKKLPAPPTTSLIVKWNGKDWVDERGSVSWNKVIPYRLADVDVVVIDAKAASVRQEIRHLGTLIANAAFDNSARRLLVANTDALNHIRFEPVVRGRFIRTRLAAINVDEAKPKVTSWNLNPHVNYDAEGSETERALSLALPSDVKVAGNGNSFVAASGSMKVGVMNRRGEIVARIGVGKGPTGLALDERRNRLYVLNRFENTLSVVDTSTFKEVRRQPLGHNPEPEVVQVGRVIFNDAQFSAHGDIACSSCHAHGQTDGLAWDLGDPNGKMVTIQSVSSKFIFHPLKGPMMTQTLRDSIGLEPLHWRGDRNNLSEFNPAFMSLQGGPRQLSEKELDQLTEFVRSLAYPPNPRQNLDRSYQNPATGASPLRGEEIFRTVISHRNTQTCVQCHTLPGNGTNKDIIPAVFRQESQSFKVAQLRGLYHKVGKVNGEGEQISGFGFLHDGSDDTLFNMLGRPFFTKLTEDQRRDLEVFLLSLDTGMAPAVGLQVTVNAENKSSRAVVDRIALLASQADSENCDLIVTGLYKRTRRGFLYVGKNQFRLDQATPSVLTLEELTNGLDKGAALTFMGVVRGTGLRLAFRPEGQRPFSH